MLKGFIYIGFGSLYTYTVINMQDDCYGCAVCFQKPLQPKSTVWLAVGIGGEQYKVGLLGMSGGKIIFVCPEILSHLFAASFLHS